MVKEAQVLAGITRAVSEATAEYAAANRKHGRKTRGQFFTGRKTAEFMAGLFTIPADKDSISVLDPGAGTGILSSALAERLDAAGNIKNVKLVCYENDESMTELLMANLELLKRNLTLRLDYEIRTDDYILSQGYEYGFGRTGHEEFDMVVGNPPYRTISGSSPEAKVMPDICGGTPNLYFMFAAMSMFNLKQGGELVYIIPRSWTSGAYFGKFREKLFSEGVLKHIHLFRARRNIFDGDDILQETVIIRLAKTHEKPRKVTVTTSLDGSFAGMTSFQASYSSVVSGRDNYVFLAADENEADILERFAAMNRTLVTEGMRMRTGLTVDFRCSELLRDEAGKNTVPLFRSCHIRGGDIVFPLGKENEYIISTRRGLLQENRNYLFVKRFTSKEESRRLQCGVYLAGRFPDYLSISTDNKINFIDSESGVSLTEKTVYGLFVLFNSSMYDRYYRILDGSTQVNSMEINSVPVPGMDIIDAMGERLMISGKMTVEACDGILGGFLR